MAELGGMVASAILKVVGEQIGSAIGGQITLQKDFTEDLKKMKMALESVEAVLEDAERLSVTTKSVRLWLKRLKDAMYDISDMIDEFEADTQAIKQPSPPKAARVHLEDDASFTMHDLVHDLAIYVLDDEILVATEHGSTGGSYCHYALLNDCSEPLKSSKIRALHFQNCGEIEIHDTAFSSAKYLRVLDLSQCSIHKFPNSIGQLKQLRSLNAPRVQDEVIPNSITRLSKLLYLNLSESSAIKALPELIGEMEELKYLNLSGCSGIQGLPESLGKLKKLVHLDLSHCSHVNGLSLLLGGLTELQYLNLSYCKNIGELPETLGGLSKLQYLNLAFSSYLECCQEGQVLAALTKLKYLNLCSECCELKNLPEALASCINLEYLNLSGCERVQELPRSFRDLKNLVHLDLSHCPEVSGVPEALVGLTKLQYLNLKILERKNYKDQCLKGLPEVISNFTKLRYLNLDGCIYFIFGTVGYTSKEEQPIDSFLYSISTLVNLEHLDLSRNCGIDSIPESFCNLTKLHTLDISQSGHASVPESVCRMDSLRFIYSTNHMISNQSQLSGSLVALPHFVVHADDGASSSNLLLLQGTDPIDLEITGLEHVKSVQEVQIIGLCKKQRLVNLKLEWTRDTERLVDDKILLENLVPPSTLRTLEIQGYNGVSFPPWLIGQLPNLIKLDLRDMQHLEEWNMPYNGSEDEHVIGLLNIHDCPKLTMKSCLPSATCLSISNSDNVLLSWGECVLTSRTDAPSPAAVTTYLAVSCSNVPLNQWKLLHHFHSLTILQIQGCGDLTGSPEITGNLNSLETLDLEAKDHEELPEWLSELKSLYELKIQYRGIKELHDNMRQLTKLQSLELNNCKSMTSLPHWLGELTSLKKIKICACDSIRSFPESIQHLTNLQELRIESCPELQRWCESEENKMKLAHVRVNAGFSMNYSYPVRATAGLKIWEG